MKRVDNEWTVTRIFSHLFLQQLAIQIYWVVYFRMSYGIYYMI